LNRSSYYAEPARESPTNLRLMRLIDEQYLRTPFFGSRRMTAWLAKQGERVMDFPTDGGRRVNGLSGSLVLGR
jgi:hypothetical protein